MRALLRYLQAFARRRRLDGEAREELGFHFEMFVAERVRRGLSEEEARRQARIELGDPEPVAEELADGRPGALLDALVHDLRQSRRALLRSPGFAAVCVLLVALGVAASTALFTLVERVLLRPLPFPHPERLVRLFETSREHGVARTGVARGNLAAWRAEARLFEGMAVGFSMGRTLSDAEGSEVVLAAQVSCDFLPLLGVRPLHGRVFSEDECRRARYSNAAAPVGADPVALLGHGLWKRRFGGDPAVVGRTLLIERQPFRVVGVLGADIELPEPGVEAFLAWDLEGDLNHDQRYPRALARLRPGVTLAAAQAELDAACGRLATERPETNRGWGASVVPLHEETTGGARPVLLVLLAASGLLLLIACANVAILAYARGSARAREAALRMALGAGRARILRQGLLEAGLLAVAGGALGTLLAGLLVAGVPRLWPDLPRVHELELDAAALVFALLATLAAAIGAGLLPAWRVARTEPRAALGGGHQATANRRTQSARDALVVAEVALTVVLLVGAGLLLRSVSALRAADPGFEPQGVLVAPIFLDGQAYGSGQKSRDYYARLFERLRELPGVTAVGGATTLPTSPLGPDFERPVWPAGAPGEPAQAKRASIRIVTPGYLEALRIRVVEGRAFDAAETPAGKPVVAISQTLARSLWPAESAIGKTLVVDYSSAGTHPYEVVGVIADVLFRGPRSEPLREVYFPHAQRPYLILNVALRTTGGHDVAGAVRRAISELDPQKPAHGVERLEDLLGATYARERRAMQLLVAFAAAACLLSGLAVYGMLAYRVRQRAAEIGVRVSLGASRGRIVRWVAAFGARLIGIGSLLGLAGAALGVNRLESLLYGVQAADPLTALGVLAALAAVGALAIVPPAWRAARLDPAAVLRQG